MGYYSHYIIDSEHRVSGTPNNFKVEAPKFPNSTQFRLKRVSIPNLSRNVTADNNRLMVKAQIVGPDTRYYVISVPAQFYPTPDALLTILNDDNYWVETISGIKPVWSSTWKQPVWTYDEKLKKFQLTLDSCIGLSVLGSADLNTVYPFIANILLNDRLGFSNSATAFAGNLSAGSNSTQVLSPPGLVNLRPTDYIIIESNSLLGLSQTKFHWSNNMHSSTLGVLIVNADFGEWIRQDIGNLFDYKHHNSHLVDITLYDDKHRLLDLPLNARIVLEFEFYSFNAPVAVK